MNDYTHDNGDRNLSGSHYAMEYNAAGEPALRVIANLSGWGIQVADGAVDGVSSIEKFGMNVDVDSDKETIWDGGDIYEYIETAETVGLSSTSPQDNPTGSGARTVEVQGLNAAGEVVEETINMGATSTTEFKRVFRAIAHVAGASGVNEGTISITSSDTSTLLAQIGVDGSGSHRAGRGQTFMALYTVPAGKTAYLTQWTVGAGKQNTDAVAFLMVRDPDAVGNGAWQSKDVITVSATTYSKDYKVPLKVKAGDDIEVRAYSTTNNSLVSSTFNLILIDN